MTGALYAPLIERDLDAIPAAARAFRDEHGSHELFLAIARFAVLAYAPSQHGKHALLACLSTWELRDELGDRFDDMVIACARYAAEARQPWSEPPILDQPSPGTGSIDELREAVATGDHHLGERWLAARLDDCDRDLLEVATDDFEDLGHKLIVTNAALKLAPILGEKGRYAMMRVAILELTAYRGEAPEKRGEPDLTQLLEACDGSIESAHAVFLYDAARESGMLDRLSLGVRRRQSPLLLPKPKAATAVAALLTPLSRDYGAYLKAHAVAKRLNHPLADAFVAAVGENLARSEGFEEWQ